MNRRELRLLCVLLLAAISLGGLAAVAAPDANAPGGNKAPALVPDSKQPEGVRNAKSLQGLKLTGEWLQALLPQDMDNILSQWFKKRPKGDEDTDAPPGQRSDANSPAVTGSVRPTAAYPRADRTDMRQLIDATKQR